jgi:succinate dehydrogenase/fumarate reductase flavoprotein subunit
MQKTEYDVVVVGAGAGGLATAVTAAKHGLDVVVVEKEPLFGGTTARSGGVLWIPCSPHARALGIEDDVEAARTYLRHEAGAAYDERRINAFLRNAPQMLEFFESSTSVRFLAVPGFSDYHPDAPGGRPGGRSIVAAPFAGTELGEEIRRLRPPLREITFVGMMFNSSLEIAHFFNVTRSLKSALYVVRRLAQHGRDLLVHGRGMRLGNGNALAARLAKSAFDLGVPILTSCPARMLLLEQGAVRGVEIESQGVRMPLRARRGVVLAGGGFSQDPALRARLFPHAPSGREHRTAVPPGNTGDGWRLAESAGAQTVTDLPNAAAWIPVSLVARAEGEPGVFPHLIDRYKPGVIAVTRRGTRFVNEANSYHDFGQALQRTCRGDAEVCAFLICDHRALRRYGLGFVKPFPLPLFPHLRSGYLLRGRNLAHLAQLGGIDAEALQRTIESVNADARRGKDTQFGKGTTAYNRFLGDAGHKPNPCVAPIERPPFYAVKVMMGDLGTFAGIRTDEHARVLDARANPVEGLYAVGNDAASVMGGSYPGGGITLGAALTFGFIAGRHLAAPAGGARPEPASNHAAQPASVP